jgi:hypothetical protein
MLVGIIIEGETRDRHRLRNTDRSNISMFEILVVRLELSTLESFACIWDNDQDHFLENWTMARVQRINAGIMPGPINSLTKFDTIQVGLVYGQVLQPFEDTRRGSRVKSILRMELVKSMTSDILMIQIECSDMLGDHALALYIYSHADQENAPFGWLRLNYSGEVDQDCGTINKCGCEKTRGASRIQGPVLKG